MVVRKVRVGAFSTADLEAQLQARGVDTLILAGISTSGVVLSTVEVITLGELEGLLAGRS